MDESKLGNDGIEKVDDNSSESPNEASIDTIEYPAKFKLGMIVVALVLSMFLVSETFEMALPILSWKPQLTSTGISGHGKLPPRYFSLGLIQFAHIDNPIYRYPKDHQ